MAEKEIKIGFSEAKMEALEFFLRENNTTVEEVLSEHLNKTYEKSVPQQVRKFVESKVILQQDEMASEESGSQRQGRGRGRHSSRQNATRETVQEQEVSGVQSAEDTEIQETVQEQENSMIMEM